MKPTIDFQATAAAALAQAQTLVASWLPEGKRQGPEWIALNPRRPDAHPGSFTINLNSGKWADFATNDKGGDLVSLYGYLHGLPNQADAARALAGLIGATPAAQAPGPTTSKRPPPPPPGAIPRHAQDQRPAVHGKLGKPSAVWTYRNAQGEPIGYVCRFDLPTGEKEIRPLTWSPTTHRWAWQAPPAPRPLYNLDRLAAKPEALVIVVEGEKAADACQSLYPEAVAVTSMGGAQSPNKTDWSPLAGRCVRVWPDADDAGTHYAAVVVELLRHEHVRQVEILDIASLAQDPATGSKRELTPGWDAADALRDGWSAGNIATAAIWTAPPERNQPKKAKEQKTASPAAKQRSLPKPEVERPSYAVHPEWTAYGKPGLYWHGSKGQDENDKDEINLWICSPLWADAVTASEKEADFGLLLRFTNALGHEREWSMPMRLLRGSGEELRGELLDLGVRIDPSCHKQLNGYLMSRLPERRVLAATATGWHSDGQVFVMPDTTLGEGDVRYQSEHAHHDEFATAGTLAGWQDELAARCIGNPALTFAVSAALAGPFLAKIQRPGGGFHLFGDSSSGKTTLLHVAASCWGGAGFIRTWQATAAGLEGIAAAVTDTCLVLDEISEADPRTIGSIVYQLGNGTGRTRGERTGGARAVQRWRVILLSTGERTLSVTMAEGGRAPKSGMEARLLDIPCARAYGVFDAIHAAPDARAFSDSLRTAAARHHGHAGPELVKRIIAATGTDFGSQHARILGLPLFAHDNALEGRAAHAFALVALAGELANEWGIVPWSEGDAIHAAAWAYNAWRTGRPKGQSETTQILRSVSDFLSRHGDSRFSNLVTDGNTHLPPIRDRAGWWRDAETTRIFMFTSEGLREAAAGFDFRRALKALDGAGWISERDSGKTSKKVKVQGRAQSLYHIAVPEGEE